MQSYSHTVSGKGKEKGKGEGKRKQKDVLARVLHGWTSVNTDPSIVQGMRDECI